MKVLTISFLYHCIRIHCHYYLLVLMYCAACVWCSFILPSSHTQRKNTALGLAVQNGYISIVQLLCSSKADMNARNAVCQLSHGHMMVLRCGLRCMLLYQCMKRNSHRQWCHCDVMSRNPFVVLNACCLEFHRRVWLQSRKPEYPNQVFISLFNCCFLSFILLLISHHSRLHRVDKEREMNYEILWNDEQEKCTHVRS